MGKKLKQSKISKKIYRSHLNLVSDMNDTLVFLGQVKLILEEKKWEYETSRNNEDKKYYITDIKDKFAQRTEEELKSIYDKFLSRELYESFFVTLISKFEDFLESCLLIILKEHPDRILLNSEGIDTSKNIDFEDILKSEDKEEIIERTISKKLATIFYAKPEQYMKYFMNITRFGIPKEVVGQFIELKATRDIIIHNKSIINNAYLEKAKQYPRGNINEKIIFDKGYFDISVLFMRKISGIVTIEADRLYPQ
ncbi:hypothetical protein KAJ38_02550 [Candidatus Pacearchaeota archaeon]|nr:hypothetical protein [Candidatus Pacearchaeota archaeon]